MYMYMCSDVIHSLPCTTPLQALADSAIVEFPFTNIHYAIKSSVSMATIVKSRLLTREGSVKRTLELEIDIKVRSYVCV